MTVIGAALAVLIAAGGGLYWFLRDDAPEAVSLDAAASGVAGADAAASASPEGVEGTWVVDTSSGSFDFETATGTFVGFRVQEELSRIGATTAVGRTNDVTGTAEIEGTTLRAARFEVDITGITTNDDRRDDKVQEALDGDRFPTATFALTEPVDLGPAAAEGGPVSVTVPGELTIHRVTHDVEIALEAQMVGSTIVVVGSTDVVFSDYGVKVPSASIVLSVDDHGVLEFQILLVKEPS